MVKQGIYEFQWPYTMTYIYYFLQLLYQLVFCKGNLSQPFGIFTQYPRSLLGLDVLIAGVEGTLVVEERFD